MNELLTNENVAFAIKAVLGLLGMVAVVFLAKYRLAINKVINLLAAIEAVSDEDTTPEEVEALKFAWNEMKDIFKNYTEVKKANGG